MDTFCGALIRFTQWLSSPLPAKVLPDESLRVLVDGFSRCIRCARGQHATDGSVDLVQATSSMEKFCLCNQRLGDATKTAGFSVIEL